MAIWIRRIVDDKSENVLKLAENIWDIKSQFTIFEKWLKGAPAILATGEGWIADFGFSLREDACGGGPIISLELMEICLKHKITIFLSEYSD